MATTQYIGARYVPLFADPLDWSIESTYEALTIVYDSGNSYTSRQAVPKGIDITNTKYWALTGNYNAQIEAYRKEVADYDGRITKNASAIAKEVSRAIAEETSIKALITKAQTAADNALSLAQTNEKDIATLDSEMAGTADSGLKTLITDNTTAITNEATRATKAESLLKVVDYVVPEYVGDFVSYNGIAFDVADSDACCFNQGFCVGATDATLVTALTDSSDSKAQLNVSNITDNTTSTKATAYTTFNHANAMCYNASQKLYYVANSPDYSMSVLSSTFTYSKSITVPDELGKTWFVPMYDRATGKMYITNYYSIWSYENSKFTKLVTLSESAIDTPYDVNTAQGASIYNGVIVFTLSENTTDTYNHTCGFKAYDLSTGELIKRIAMPTESEVGYYGELEDCDFDSNGILYFTTYRYNSSGSSSYAKIATTYRCDIFNGSYGVNVLEPNRNVYVEAANYSGFRSDGTAKYPFKDLLEWNLFINAKGNKIGKSFFGLNTTYSTTTAQNWNGIIELNQPNNVLIYFNSANNITIVGYILVTSACNVFFLNRLNIKEMPKNANSWDKYLVWIQNGNVYSGGVKGYLNGNSTSKVTNTVYLQYNAGFVGNYVQLTDTTNTPAVGSNPSGLGYVIGSPRSGSWA